jgi:hypothetical protein
MSVDSKIKQLLERLEARKLDEAEQMGAGSVKKDSTLSAKLPGDASNPKQGSSEDASFESRDEKDPNQGAKAAAPVSKAPVPSNSGAGAAPNFTTVADPRTVVNQANSKGNVHKEADETNAEETVIEEVTEDEVSAEAPAETVVEPIDLSPIFGADLSEDFKEKATSIFEAAVVARVNHEMEKINAALDEKFAEDVAEFQKQIVEKVDSYLNYVVENWMKENEVAIESGLRTEIAEDFIQGLQVLFKEHYIEVPEEKYDVIGELEAQTVELTSQMDDIMSENVQLKQQVVEMKRLAVIEEMSKDLAATDASRLAKLLEGVQFEDEQLYREKVSVIVENFISKPSVNETVTSTAQPLVEDVAHAAPAAMDDSIVNQYAQALSRTIKKK